MRLVTLMLMFYDIIHCDHLSNTKTGFVYMFHKDYPVIRRDDLCALVEYIITEVKLGEKEGPRRNLIRLSRMRFKVC